MIQFKKIPPGKSVLLLLLFLTTSTYGFLRDHQDEYELPRKTHNRFTMDLQQPVTRNMPIRRVGIDRVINEKDENAERLYDRRSFRTGTIQKTENIQSRERSVEPQQLSRVEIRDHNNNRQRLATNHQDRTNYSRENRRYFELTLARENHQRLTEARQDRRVDERAVITRNRQYGERTLNRKTERDLDRRVERLSDVRDQRNVDIKNSNRRNAEQRSINTQRNTREDIRENVREVRGREISARRKVRELPQNQRRAVDRLGTNREIRLAENRFSSYLTRRFVRSIDIRDRRASPERNLDQRRLFQERSRDNSLENNNRRISEGDERRLTSEISNTRTERSDSRQNDLQRQTVQSRNFRISDLLVRGERRSRSTARSAKSDSRESHLQGDRRISENRRSVSRSEIRTSEERQTRSSSERRNTNDIRNARVDRARNVRGETRDLSRQFSDTRRFTDSVERRDRRIFERQDINSRDITSDERRNINPSQRTEYLQKPKRNVDRITDDRRLVEGRSISREDRSENTRMQSRSDSTRYIQDNIRFRDIRFTHREDSATVSSEERMNNRLNERSSTIIDRYYPLTTNSRRSFEKIVSQRARDSVRNTDAPILGLERNINNETYTWANTVKVILAAFLIGQIFVNSSKANKFKFHNILSLATSIKEKVH